MSATMACNLRMLKEKCAATDLVANILLVISAVRLMNHDHFFFDENLWFGDYFVHLLLNLFE